MSDFPEVVPLSHYGHDCNELRCARWLTYEMDEDGNLALVRVVPVVSPDEVGRQ
jgi:hypothetical protein